MSEFVGCSSSLSGAFRVNPWNVEDVADAMYRAATLSGVEAEARHEKHWRYISEHTVGHWAASNIAELQRATETTGNARCYGLGFGLNFRVVALDPNFRKLETARLAAEYATRSRRVLLLDYDGTLVPQASYDQPPSKDLLQTLKKLTEDPNNAAVCIVSGRQRKTLDDWFGESVPNAGFLAEHGYWYKAPKDARESPGAWRQLAPVGTEEHIKKWHAIVMPILEQYTDSTDGAFIKDKGTSVIWHYGDADPDFGAWQAKELMDHLESVLVNDPVDVFPGNGHVEIKPQGVSKGPSRRRTCGVRRATRWISCSPSATTARTRRCSTPSPTAWRTRRPSRRLCSARTRARCPATRLSTALPCTSPRWGRNPPRRTSTSTTRTTSSSCSGTSPPPSRDRAFSDFC